MKKLLPLVLSLLLLLCACGASSNDEGPIFKVKDGAFSCSAQELIDSINDATKDSEDFPQIAALTRNTDDVKDDSTDKTVTFEEYTGNTFTDNIEIASDLTMTLDEDNGKLLRVKVTWTAESSDSSIGTKSKVLTSTLLTLLVPDPDFAQKTISKINSYGTGNGGSTTGNVDVWYDKSDESGLIYFEIQVHKERGQF